MKNFVVSIIFFSFASSAFASVKCPDVAATHVAESAAVLYYLNHLDNDEVPKSISSTILGQDSTSFLVAVHFEGLTSDAGDATMEVCVLKKDCVVPEDGVVIVELE